MKTIKNKLHFDANENVVFVFLGLLLLFSLLKCITFVFFFCKVSVSRSGSILMLSVSFVFGNYDKFSLWKLNIALNQNRQVCVFRAFLVCRKFQVFCEKN